MIAAPLAVVLALAQAGPTFEFSAGPFERTWALVDARVEPALPADLPLGAADRDENWTRWAERIAACRAASPAERAAARLWAAAFAARGERSDDAWDHLAQAGEAPAGLRALLPLLAPGVAPGDLAAWPRLPEGARLAPLCPPPAVPAREVLLGLGRVREGRAIVRGFQVGAATLELSLSVEGDGVMIELAHRGGGACTLVLQVPVAPDFALTHVTLDWDEVPDPRAGVRVSLAPGGESVTVFGRWRPRRIAWPTSTPRGLHAEAELDGLCLWLPPGERAAGLSAGLAGLLDVAVRVDDGLLPPARGVVLDLRDDSTHAAKLAGIVSLAERFALAR